MTFSTNTVMRILFELFTASLFAENIKDPSAAVGHGTLPAIDQVVIGNF